MVLCIISVLCLMLNFFGLFSQTRLIPLMARIIPLLYFQYFSLFYVFKPSGIYKVGVKEVKNGLIYYPCKIDKDLKKYKWIRYGNNGLKGFWRAWTFGKLDTTWEEFRYRDMLKYHIPAFENAEVHQDFTSDLKKMNPIIFTPGIMGTTTLCSSICIELASYGFYVYCIEHTDKSFCYYLDTDGGYK